MVRCGPLAVCRNLPDAVRLWMRMRQLGEIESKL
jgi:hypothetical protein